MSHLCFYSFYFLQSCTYRVLCWKPRMVFCHMPYLMELYSPPLCVHLCFYWSLDDLSSGSTAQPVKTLTLDITIGFLERIDSNHLETQNVQLKVYITDWRFEQSGEKAGLLQLYATPNQCTPFTSFCVCKIKEVRYKRFHCPSEKCDLT